MASQVFITYKDDTGKSHYYELTCSTDIELNYSNEVTNHTVENGDNISDHVHNNPVNISIRGIITEIHNYGLDYNKSPDELIAGLLSLRKARKRFTVNVDDSLEVFDNCVFTNLQFSKSSGYGGTWDAVIGIKQIRLSNSAILSEFADEINDIYKQHADKTQQGDSGTESARVSGLKNISSTFLGILSEGIEEDE